MKTILFLFIFILPGVAWATCTSPISRTNNSANSVLTSTKYNSDLNTVYAHVNDLDGDCLADGSVESTKLDTTTLAPLVKGVKEGCFATRSDANTISIDKCLIAVNGNLIEKTTSTTITWGCGGCSSEVASTTYYVYATSASTLTLLISTSAPDAYGYSGTSRALARFYNNASSDIDTASVRTWVSVGFIPTYSSVNSSPGVSQPKTCRGSYGGAGSLTSQTACTTGTCTEYYDTCQLASTGDMSTTYVGAGNYTVTLASGTCKANSWILCRHHGSTGSTVLYNASYSDGFTNSSGGYSFSALTNNTSGTGINVRLTIICECEFP